MIGAGDLRAVVRGGDFRRLLATRVTGQCADGLVTAALTSYVFFSPERQATAAQMAAAFATLLLPYSLVGPFAGVLLDRWRRRQVLAVGNAVRACLVVGVAAVVLTGSAGPGFYAAGLLSLSVNRFILAALSAALPHVVATRTLVTANAVSTTSGTIAALLGGGVGFGVRRAVGGGDATVAASLALAVAAYAGAALLARRMHRDLLGPDLDRPRPRAAEALHHVARGMVAGARHVVVDRPRAGEALATIGAHRFVYGLSTVATLLIYRNHLNDPGRPDAAFAGLGLAVAASGAGFFLAAVLTPPVVRRIRKETWLVAGFAGAAATEAFYVVGPLTGATLVAGAFVVGTVAQATKICVDTIVQESVDDAFRGRVFSFYDVLFNVAFVAAAASGAVLLPPDGYSRGLFAGLAAGYALTAGVYGVLTRPGERSQPVPPGPDSGCSAHQRNSSASAVARSTGPTSIR